MVDSGIESRLQAITNALVEELISITPESIKEIQFEIVATEDDGADIGLLENHPDVVGVSLSNAIYDNASRYLPVVKRYAPGWRRSLIVLRELESGWDASVTFEYK